MLIFVRALFFFFFPTPCAQSQKKTQTQIGKKRKKNTKPNQQKWPRASNPRPPTTQFFTLFFFRSQIKLSDAAHEPESAKKQIPPVDTPTRPRRPRRTRTRQAGNIRYPQKSGREWEREVNGSQFPLSRPPRFLGC